MAHQAFDCSIPCADSRVNLSVMIFRYLIPLGIDQIAFLGKLPLSKRDWPKPGSETFFFFFPRTLETFSRDALFPHVNAGRYECRAPSQLSRTPPPNSSGGPFPAGTTSSRAAATGFPTVQFDPGRIPRPDLDPRGHESLLTSCPHLLRHTHDLRHSFCVKPPSVTGQDFESLLAHIPPDGRGGSA
ncbi:hypothetical protein LX32DRAFT_277075 [Colletotrichum zoysiae]|uniref:Uncharacterized protein n=1 Tax=Colletotrichum zoysiae TaxID=1216348 RepID=A0AAD9H2B7_9PEZI|nr:hypothetical protein LX32DRAFT_277075 [Colletotrichum zoysiae]